MTKTLNVLDEVHLLVLNKWIELKNKGIDIKVSKVADQAIIHGIELVKDEDFKNNEIPIR